MRSHHTGTKHADRPRHRLQVAKAEIVNVLEDPMEELDVTTYENKEEIDLGVFRAFEVKTVKLYL